jgi:hypothetical protein
LRLPKPLSISIATWTAFVKKRPNLASREPIALVELVCLLARQAAREWAERRLEGDQPTKPIVSGQQS